MVDHQTGQEYYLSQTLEGLKSGSQLSHGTEESPRLKGHLGHLLGCEVACNCCGLKLQELSGAVRGRGTHRFSSGWRPLGPAAGRACELDSLSWKDPGLRE